MKRSSTLTTLVIVFASVLLAGLVIRRGNASLVPKVHAQEGCSLATLQGSYLVTGRGDTPSDVPDDPTFPRVFLGVWNLDGEGHLSGFVTSSQGGQISRRTPLTATYTLDPDCTGTLTFLPSGAEWELFVTTDGSEGGTLNLNTSGDRNVATRYFKRR